MNIPPREVWSAPQLSVLVSLQLSNLSPQKFPGGLAGMTLAAHSAARTTTTAITTPITIIRILRLPPPTRWPHSGHLGTSLAKLIPQVGQTWSIDPGSAMEQNLVKRDCHAISMTNVHPDPHGAPLTHPHGAPLTHLPPHPTATCGGVGGALSPRDLHHPIRRTSTLHFRSVVGGLA
jgi:hypothetical protein